ncbi:MAG: hypothetical protein AMQ74_01319 [Candidatus Methanofastidiosum methylothiophilum]|jgi:hypothetical protein|uniref:Uncharacterized protein n=1 Tax=Candidatus Methanofastidiosum methylothiophilum TaxID=1705564 RepID=A0A150IYE9_9EURY|nr:MAG: hypothetical protein AMQ74_01319 [Candidatus Methanofastidiosum methylthiophilus]
MPEGEEIKVEKTETSELKEETKIDEQNLNSDEIKKEILPHKIVILKKPVIRILLALVLLIVLLPTKTISIEEQIAYSEIESYVEKQPFEVNESYEELIPYEEKEIYTEIVPTEKTINYEIYDYYTDPTSHCELKPQCQCNRVNPLTKNCTQCSCYRIITAQKTEIINEEIEKERIVTKYKTETKYRTVTKYKDVNRSREVVKVKTENKEVEVNWILGFRTPYKLHIF